MNSSLFSWPEGQSFRKPLYCALATSWQYRSESRGSHPLLEFLDVSYDQTPPSSRSKGTQRCIRRCSLGIRTFLSTAVSAARTEGCTHSRCSSGAQPARRPTAWIATCPSFVRCWVVRVDGVRWIGNSGARSLLTFSREGAAVCQHTFTARQGGAVHTTIMMPM